MSKLIILSVSIDWAIKLHNAGQGMTVSEMAFLAREWGFGFHESWELANWGSSL